MVDNNCVCMRNLLHDQETVDFEYFWSSVAYDVCGHREPPKDWTRHVACLYASKSLILMSDEFRNNYIFTIGISPIAKFSVAIRLELEHSGLYIELVASEVKELFAQIHEIFDVKQSNLDSAATSYTIGTLSRRLGKVRVELAECKRYKVSVKDRYILMTEDALKQLLKNRLYIDTLMIEYGVNTDLYENSVFKLLHICCQYIRDSTDENNESTCTLSFGSGYLSEKFDLNDILIELMTSTSCDCFSSSFIMETKLHFERMITFWIGRYYETLLLSETVRLDSFKNKWSSQIVTANTLAKNGFFYVGPSDRVQCVFCKVILSKWELGDTVEGEHKRIIPFCSMHFGTSSNIPLIDGLVKSPEGVDMLKTKSRWDLLNIFKKKS